jgi:hypothetical protein
MTEQPNATADDAAYVPGTRPASDETIDIMERAMRRGWDVGIRPFLVESDCADLLDIIGELKRDRAVLKGIPTGALEAVAEVEDPAERLDALGRAVRFAAATHAKADRDIAV